MSPALVFIFNLEQWRHVDRLALLQGGGGTIATIDVDVMAICARRSVPALDLSEYLECDGMVYQAQAADLCERFAAALSGVLPETQRRLAFQIAFDLLNPVAHCLQVFAMTGNLLRSVRPERAVCFGDHQEAFTWDPQRIPPDLANAVVRWTLEQHHVPTQLLQCPHSAETAAPMGPSILNSSVIEPLQPQTAVVSLTAGLSVGEQAELLGQDRPAVRRSMAVFPGMWMRLLPFRQEGPTLDYDHCVSEVLARLRADEAVPPVLLRNGYLQCLWVTWRNSVRGCLGAFRLAKLLSETLRPKVVITGYDVFGHTRCMNEGFLLQGIAPVSICHGGLNACDVGAIRNRRAVGHVAAWSDYDAKEISAQRDACFQASAVGSLRSDIHRALSTMSKPPYQAARAHGIAPCIVFLSCWLDYFFMRQSPGRHVTTWQSVLAYCARRHDLRFVLKKHPRYDYTELYGEPAAVDSACGLQMTASTLQETLAQADLVVLVNVNTTAALDAMCAGLPVLCLATARRGKPDIWAAESGVEIVSSVSELEVRIDELLRNHDQRRALVARLQTNLKKFICATGPEAVERLWRFVERVRPDVWDTPSSDGKKVNPVSLWCLRFAQQVEQVVQGSLRNAVCTFPADSESEAECPLDLPRLAESVFSHVLWRLRTNQQAPSALRIVLQTYRLLPRSYGPSFGQMRRYLAAASLLDSMDERRQRWQRSLAVFVTYCLAPGRLRELMKHVQRGR